MANIYVNTEYIRDYLRGTAYSQQNLSRIFYKNKSSLSSNLSQRKINDRVLQQICQITGMDYKKATNVFAKESAVRNESHSNQAIEKNSAVKQIETSKKLDKIIDLQRQINELLCEIAKEYYK